MSYIYIRDNEWYSKLDIYKVGITTSIKDRNSSYITTEFIKGSFIKIIELININNIKLKIIDKYLKNHFKYLHKYFNGGTEFYDRTIINKIEHVLNSININYRIINDNELKYINRHNNAISNYKKLFNLIINNTNDTNDTNDINDINDTKDTNDTNDTNDINDTNIIIPKDYQQDILKSINDFYSKNNIGKLIWACGIGKTIMSILISKELNFKKIIIGVYSSHLQIQFADDIIKIFNNKNNILLIGSTKNEHYKNTTNINSIISFINDYDYSSDKEPIFIITTYHSSYLLNELSFDFKISDECHHLVSFYNNDNDNKKFINFHNIKSYKSLFMTATEKIINDDKNDKKYYSMNDEKIFGTIIDKKSVKWAIDNKKITDYKIIIINNIISELTQIKDKLSSIKNKDLFIAIYMTLKSLSSINDLSHILIYTNTISDAKLANEYISKILSYNIININNDDLYYTSLHSELNPIVIKDCLSKFENAKLGIINCVQIFGEGVNCPILNGVCIACNMMSEIRIVQYLLRPNRLYHKNPDKIAYYIIPYISDIDNIKHIIRQLSMVDDTIEQKINLYSIIPSSSKNKDDINDNDNDNDYKNDAEYNRYILNENSELLLKIKMKLKVNKDLFSDFTDEENEYNYIKSINKSLKILSKNDYIKFKDIHENYIINPDIYFTKKGVWNNWCDFLNYDKSLFIPTKEEWTNFCIEKEIDNIDKYNEYTDIYPQLPKDPEDFYKDFSNLQKELLIKKEIKIKK
jgi:superfamily II DNA or RNA helicase